MNPLNPISQLDGQLNRLHGSCEFTARNPRDAQQWQNVSRIRLGKCLGLNKLEKVDPKVKQIKKDNRGDFIHCQFHLRSTRWSVVPVHLLLPTKITKPAPCVLALHGHGYGARAIVGINEDGTYRDSPAGYQKDFAVELVRRGFAVAAP